MLSRSFAVNDESGRQMFFGDDSNKNRKRHQVINVMLCWAFWCFTSASKATDQRRILDPNCGMLMYTQSYFLLNAYERIIDSQCIDWNSVLLKNSWNSLRFCKFVNEKRSKPFSNLLLHPSYSKHHLIHCYFFCPQHSFRKYVKWKTISLGLTL